MRIEWDENKNESNKIKHDVDFEDAAMIFADTNRIERYDTSVNNTSNEDRWQTIGLVRKVLFVCYTERTDVIRLISARKANSKERALYYGYNIEGSSDWSKANG